MSDPVDTIRKLAAVFETAPADPTSLAHDPDPEPIAETDLGITVKAFCGVGKFVEAAQAIELAVRRAYRVEGAP